MDIKRCLAAGFGLGWLPFAPGSWGSLLPAGLFAGMGFAGFRVAWIMAAEVVLALLGAVGCVVLSGRTIALTGKQDPEEVVLDEVAGQAICLLGTVLVFPAAGLLSFGQVVFLTVAGYLFFRFYDTIKPWPCRRLEELPAGWGILADDIVAGLYGLISLSAAVYWYQIRH